MENFDWVSEFRKMLSKSGKYSHIDENEQFIWIYKNNLNIADLLKISIKLAVISICESKNNQREYTLYNVVDSVGNPHYFITIKLVNREKFYSTTYDKKLSNAVAELSSAIKNESGYEQCDIRCDILGDVGMYEQVINDAIKARREIKNNAYDEDENDS